jgi:alpha-1,6-mannosyltransferase
MHHMTTKMPLRSLAWLGTALLALTLFGLLLDVPAAEGDGRAFRVTIQLGLLVLAAAVYFATVRLILRYAWPRATVWIVVGVAIALRLLLLTAPPILSSDIYRYAWDGRVQAAGINPYRYVPADPALASPGDRFFWPSLVYVPAILLLLADLRPWLAIKLRRGAENGETPCPL